MRGDQRVVPRTDGRWGLLTDGNSRTSFIFDRQKDAISKGRERAMENQCELIICGRDGRIRERSTFGKDHCPPKG